MLLFISYIFGFIFTFIILAFFGKKYFGIDYDGEKSYADMDDWNSNAEAYVGWSLAWPIIWIFAFIYLCIISLISLSKFILDKVEKKDEEKFQKELNMKRIKELEETLKQFELENPNKNSAKYQLGKNSFDALIKELKDEK